MELMRKMELLKLSDGQVGKWMESVMMKERRILGVRGDYLYWLGHRRSHNMLCEEDQSHEFYEVSSQVIV